MSKEKQKFNNVNDKEVESVNETKTPVEHIHMLYRGL